MAFAKYWEGEAVVVVQLRQNHKKTSWSDEKLTITLPAMTFHASSTPPSCRSALRGKGAKLAELHTKSASSKPFFAFRTFLLRSGQVFISTKHDFVDTRGTIDNRRQQRWPRSIDQASPWSPLLKPGLHCVGDCFGRIFCNLARDEPSSLLTEIATTHSKSTVKSLNFSCGMQWLRVAMDIRSATPHHLERRCFVCRAPKELKFAGNLAKTQSCRAKPLLFSKRGKTLRFFSRFERHDSFLFLLPASRIQVTCSACAAVIESCFPVAQFRLYLAGWFSFLFVCFE